jgi:guanine nucleotide-binding protein subunit alpha
MESKFRPLYRNEAARPLIVHFTCATCVLISLSVPDLVFSPSIRSFRRDTEQLKVVFAAVEESILKAAMEDLVSSILVSI